MDREAHSAVGVEHRMKRTGFGIAQNLECSRAALLDLPSVTVRIAMAGRVLGAGGKLI